MGGKQPYRFSVWQQVQNTKFGVHIVSKKSLPEWGLNQLALAGDLWTTFPRVHWAGLEVTWTCALLRSNCSLSSVTNENFAPNIAQDWLSPPNTHARTHARLSAARVPVLTQAVWATAATTTLLLETILLCRRSAAEDSTTWITRR